MTVTNEEQTRRDLYNDHRKQAWEDIQSSTDSFDQSVLTMSSGVLGLSLAFVKDIVPLSKAVWLSVLYTSWVSFVLCVAVTVVSFRVSVAAQNKNLEYLAEYYLKGKYEFFNKQSGYSRALTWLTWAAGTLFIVGLASTVVFCIKNVARVK